MYSNYYRTIKCVAFEPIHYVINMNVASSSKVFSEFDYMFLSNVLLVSINKVISLKKIVKENKYY